MKYALSVFSFLFSLQCASLAHAAALRFNGVEEATIEKLKQEHPDYFDGNLSQPRIDNIIRALMLNGDQERVSARRLDDGTIEIIASPLRLITQVSVTGNSAFRSKDILAAAGLSVDDRFERSKVIEAGEKIKQYYSERGYFNAVVEINFLKTKGSHVHVDFQIQEKDPCRIQSIVINTDNKPLEERLQFRIRKYIGKPFSIQRLKRFEDDVMEFLLENRYLKTTLKGPVVDYDGPKTAATITYELADPFRYEVTADGYSKMSRYSILKAMNLDEYERSGVDPISEMVDKIRRKYLNEGYPNVKVTSTTEDIPEQFVRRVKILIDEGERVIIDKIQVVGRIAREPEYYSKFILDNSAPLIQKGFYNRQDLEVGFKNLITELRNQGYLRARVQSSRLEYLTKPDHAILHVILDEGPLTQIRRVDFEGEHDFTDMQLADVVSVKGNSPLRLAALEESIIQLKNFYQQRGYIEMKILNEGDDLIRYNDKGTQANILFKIYEGPKVKIAKILIEGNTFTKSDVIRREVDLNVGDVLTPEKVEEAVGRLNKMGIFARVDLKTLEENSMVSDRTLVITVGEKDPGIFRVGGGFNNERKLTLRGFVGLSYNNLWGTGQAVSGRVELSSNVADVNYLEHKVSAGYYFPFVFDTRTRFRVNAVRNRYVEKIVPEEKLTVINTSNKFDFLFDRDLTKYTKLTWTALSIESSFSFDRNGNCISPTACDTSLQIVTMGPTLDIDYRDNPFLPTRGSYTRLDAEYSSPNIGSSDKVKYAKTEGTFTHYTRLGSPRWVWSNSARSGYVKNLSDLPGSGVPASRAFFLGGYSTIRGYERLDDTQRIPNKNEFAAPDRNSLVIPKDSYFYLLKTEVRYPIYDDIGGVVFYDGGDVQVTGFDFKKDYRHGAGIGLRYNTPVGPLSADYGCKLNGDQPVFKDCRFYLYFGTF